MPYINVLCSMVILLFKLWNINPLLSMWIRVGSLISVKYFNIYRACIIVLEKLMYSVFTIDNTTVSCLLLSYDTNPPATTNISFSRIIHIFAAYKIRVHVSSSIEVGLTHIGRTARMDTSVIPCTDAPL